VHSAGSFGVDGFPPPRDPSAPLRFSRFHVEPSEESVTNSPRALSSLGSHAVSVYSAAVPLTPGRTVRPVTLPAISHGVGDSLSALHAFAMGIGG
jgi:hypothetical protein